MTTKRPKRDRDPDDLAVSFLARREHSSRELTAKLTQRGIDPSQAQMIVNKLAARNLQSDIRFAEMLVRTRAAQGHGPLRVQAELNRHQIRQTVIAGALAQADWTRAAELAYRKRFGSRLMPSRASWFKAAGYLQRKGFQYEQIQAVLSSEPDSD